jgi:hypothetical protein
MTRFLSEALEAKEPFFRSGLRNLERANGNPSTDIRLSSEIITLAKSKLRELGLDPKDTSEEELYHALIEKVKQDDKSVTKALRTLAATHVSAEADVVAGIVEALNRLPDSKRCFAIKPARLKALFRKNAPKKAMKALGYRSLESMLKQEQLSLIMSAAWLSESGTWKKHFTDQYKKLSPSDFEDRNIVTLSPNTLKWKKLSDKIVTNTKHNILSFKELGAIVLLPLPDNPPAGVVTASLSLSLHELNEIRACSTFLKVNQVRPDFGTIVSRIIDTEPELSSKLLDQPVPWNLIQRYYSRLNGSFKEEVFEPYLQLEDMIWHPIEEKLAQIDKSLSFWKGTSHLGVISGRKPLSFNVVDSALNLCNEVSFNNRLTHYFKRSLWHELLLRYFNHEPVETTILSELEPELAMEAVSL